MPESVLRSLKKFCPHVSLLWHRGFERWCLWKRGDERPFTFLGTLGFAGRSAGHYEPPTIKNTVAVVGRLRRISTKYERQRLLDEIDRTDPGLLVEARGREATREMARELEKASRNRIVIARPR